MSKEINVKHHLKENELKKQVQERMGLKRMGDTRMGIIKVTGIIPSIKNGLK